MKPRHSHARLPRRALTLLVAVLLAAALCARDQIAVSAQAATLWGIDSCSTAQSVVPGTQTVLGTPQFMARYLGTANPCSMSAAEVSYLSSEDIYIMLIYSPDQTFASGTGTTEAQSAIGLAQSLGAPPGTAIFRDVEADSPITTQYIEEWYQAFESSTSGYVPAFYENPGGGDPFDAQYCAAVQSMAVIGSVPLWSSEPELQSYTPQASAAPAWNPEVPSCTNNTVAWQYLEQGVNPGNWPPNSPNVDVDEFAASAESLLWNAPKGPGAYTPLASFRVCDTRAGTGTGCSGHGLTPGGTLNVQVTGVTGPSGQSVPSGAQSVVLNVTAIAGSATTYLTVFPTGYALPNASSINVDEATNQANLVVVALGAGGQVSLYNAQGSINVAVDVEGYFAAPTGASGTFHPIAPLRVCDSRSGMGTACSGTPLTAGAWQKVVVSGCPEGDPGCTGSVPSDGTAEAVALNLTAVDGSSGTYLSVVPPNGSDACPTTTPSFSNLNVGPAHNLPNRVIVPLGPEQDVCVYNSLGTINFILDINGWFGDGSERTPGALFYAVSPLRICDTRPVGEVGYSTECTNQILTPGDTLTVPVAGVDGLPPATGSSPPVAVIANVTAVNGTSGTIFTLYPAGVSRPLASDLNINASQNVANLGIVQLSSSGAFDLYNDLGTINAVVDIAGWFE
ncbi:MAG: glycoside hydrolase domain-containing protein [Candidatus Dormibacteria bacterium]|jgi:hypothetical protein